MIKLLGKIVGTRELRKLLVLFAISAVIEGIALALMIPFLRTFLAGEPITGWLIAICAAGILFLASYAFAMTNSYRISIYDVCDALIDRIADRVLKLPLGWFNAEREAAIASAVSREINTLSHIASIIIPAILNAFVVPGVMLLAIFFIDWRLALVMLIAVPLLAWIWRLMRIASTRASEIETEAAVQAAGRIIEFARLQPVLRANGLTKKGWDVLDAALEKENVAVQDALKVKGRPASMYSLVLQIAFAIAISYGLSHALGTQLDMAAYLAIMVVVARMLPALAQSVLYSTEIHNSKVALEAIYELVSAQPLPEPPAEHCPEITSTDVAFTDVKFGYDESQPVLEGINFTSQAGTVTALVGPSGAGKSTVLRLIGRFWDVDDGSVTIGGVDVRQIPTAKLMELTSMVFQDVYLFDTTIRENVRMARPDATDEELAEAARKARLDHVIDSLPDGWETNVGQGGLKLSGGERQRVSIARAFIKDAPILLLDEITSALDGENEAAITSVMKDLAKGRTVFVVAHRLSTIRDADQVIVLQPKEDGPAHIAEMGTPDDLMQREGLYADFVEASSAAGRWRLG